MQLVSGDISKNGLCPLKKIGLFRLYLLLHTTQDRTMSHPKNEETDVYFVQATFPIQLKARSGFLSGLNEVAAVEGQTIDIKIPSKIKVGRHVAEAYLSFMSDLGRVCKKTFADSRDSKKWNEEWFRVNEFFDGDFPVYPMTEWLIELYATNPEMARMAIRDVERRHGEFLTQTFVADPYRHLIRVTEEMIFVNDRLDFDHSHAALVRPWVHIRSRRSSDPDPVYQTPSVKSLNTMCVSGMPLAQIQNIPWFAHRGVEGGGVIVAGGALVSGLYSRPMSEGQDTDVFIIASSASQALDVWKLFYTAICDHYGGVNNVKTAVGLVVTDIFANRIQGALKPHKFQVIRKAFPSPSHVIHGFDLDICGILYDGKYSYMTEHALRTCNTGVILYDENKLSTTVDSRIAKYVKRHGLRTLVVGASQEEVDDAVLDIEVMMIDPVFESTNKLALSVTKGSRYSILGVLANLYNEKVSESDYHGHEGPHNNREDMYTLYRRIGDDYTEDMFTIMHNGNGSYKRCFSGSFNPIKCNTLDFMRYL